MSRDLDAEIATTLFGVECIHELEMLPESVAIAEAEEEFRKEYGQEPPVGWAESNIYWRYEGDYPDKWCKKCQTQKWHGDWSTRSLPEFSADIKAAWRVVEKMRERGYAFELSWHGVTWVAAFQDGLGAGRYSNDDADTPPLAICRAALAALNADQLVGVPTLPRRDIPADKRPTFKAP